MIRSSLDPASAHGFMLVSAGKGLAFQRRPSNGASSVSTAGGLIFAPRWVRLDRAANTVSAYQSADGINWALVGTDTISLGSQAYVGLAVTSHTVASAAVGVLDNVVVGVASTTPVTPPAAGEACTSVVLSRTTYYSGAGSSYWPVTATVPAQTPSCTWTVSADQGWIALNEQINKVVTQTGSGSFSVGTLVNTTGVFRTGHFTLNGTTYTVKQEQ
jgi:hypothetical protein